MLSRGVPGAYSKGLGLSPVGIETARKLARTSSVDAGYVMVAAGYVMVSPGIANVDTLNAIFKVVFCIFCEKLLIVSN